MRSQAEDAGMPVTLIGILLEMIDAMEQCCRLRQYQQQRKNNGSKQLHSLSVTKAAPPVAVAGRGHTLAWRCTCSSKQRHESPGIHRPLDRGGR